VPDFTVVVKEFPPELAGLLRWYGVVRSGDRLWYTTKPCRSAAEARAVAGSWLNAFHPERVVQTGHGTWELPPL
jgi:hypothetical protein